MSMTGCQTSVYVMKDNVTVWQLSNAPRNALACQAESAGISRAASKFDILELHWTSTFYDLLLMINISLKFGTFFWPTW